MSEQDEQVGIPLTGVKEYAEGFDVELVRGPLTGGRFAIRALNEAGCNETIVDLWDLVDWLRLGPETRRTESGFWLSTRAETEGEPHAGHHRRN